MNCPFEDVISQDINDILESLGQDAVYTMGDAVKRVIRDDNLVRIYVFDVQNGGLAIIKNKYGYTIVTLGEDDGYFFPGAMSLDYKVSFIYLMGEAISLLNNIH